MQNGTKLNVGLRLKGLIVLHPYPLQQLALHEGFDHVVCGGEVPGLVSNVDRLETRRERVLDKNTHLVQTVLKLHIKKVSAFPLRVCSDLQHVHHLLELSRLYS